MFPYTDPGGTLRPAAALANYRAILETEFITSSRLANSAFTLLEAFDDVPTTAKTQTAVSWPAFPRSAQASNTEIDKRRFSLQDEYVEWRVERTASRIAKITFTTEFLAYYEALAQAGTTPLINAIRAVVPGANPTLPELYGPGVSQNPSALERAQRFRTFAQRNPWVNGDKGILCLAHGNNSLLALFRLVDVASIPNLGVPTASICQSLDGFCDNRRNSDPNIAAAVQQVARDGRSFSLADPVGIEILSMAGIWKLGNRQIDINDLSANDNPWKVTRGRRRGELDVRPGLLLDDEPITSGAQVAASLRVQAAVISARNADLPEWARIGNEQLVRGGGQ